MIFGSLSKFWVRKILFRKNVIFSSRRKVSRKFRNLEKVRKFLEFVGFSMCFLSKFTKDTHWKSNKFQEFYHFFKTSKFSRYFSPRWKNNIFRKNICLIQNLSSNSKIILRKPCEHSKNLKNKKSVFSLLLARYRPSGSDILCVLR